MRDPAQDADTVRLAEPAGAGLMRSVTVQVRVCSRLHTSSLLP